MDFVEAVAEVTSITKRPDKATEIASAVNKAIAFFTLKASFSKDLVEDEIDISPTVYGDTLDVLTTFTRFRKIKYLKPRGKRYYLKNIDPLHILTPNGIVQTNSFYVAGTSLTYTLSELNSILDVGYYQYAPFLDIDAATAETHWMLDMMPWAVNEKAASQIFKSVGDDVSARFYENSSMEFFIIARRDFEDQVSDAASS